MLLFRKADVVDFYGEFIRFIVFTGFFWWLLTNGPQMAHDIIGSMKTLGNTASEPPEPHRLALSMLALKYLIPLSNNHQSPVRL